MLLIKTRSELNEYLEDVRPEKSIGFVPTMGALHEGHMSLLERAKVENDQVICSVFVNPIQFNNAKDLENYPRDFDADYKALALQECDVMFYPSKEEVYGGDIPESVALNGMDEYMEGRFRPGHFDGVVKVVRRLLELIQPDRSYFGLKDYQQYAIIRHMAKVLKLDTEIIGCPTKRSESGLALSSRNLLLSNKGLNEAAFIYQELQRAAKLFEKYKVSVVRSKIYKAFEENPEVDLEYFEIADADSLEPKTDQKEKSNSIACLAAHVEGVRLIDNLILIP